MQDRAHITSLDAIEAFRASLVIYLAKVRPLLEEISTDLRRTQLWLDTDQRLYWERQVRQCERRLEQAQQALMSARLSSLREVTAIEQSAVQRARRQLEASRERQRRTKKWSREFGPSTETLARQLTSLDSFLSQDMVKALAQLTEWTRILAEYTASRSAMAPRTQIAVAADQASTQPSLTSKLGAGANLNPKGDL
jgi:hypothetical protein